MNWKLTDVSIQSLLKHAYSTQKEFCDVSNWPIQYIFVEKWNMQRQQEDKYLLEF